MPVRVLHLLRFLDTGGLENGVVNLVNGADPSRVVAGICSFRPAEGFRARLHEHVGLFEFARPEGNDPGLVLELARLFRREKPDILHTHAWGTLCEGLIAARLAGVPRVVHGEHGTMELRPRNIAVQRFAWKRADRLLSVSERLADRMSEAIRFPRERIQTIRNGVDVERFASGNRERTRAAFGAGSDDVLILAVGRLVDVKNHSMLVDAVARLRASGVQCRLLIAGDGPLFAELDSKRQLRGLTSAVELLGTRNDLPDLLAGCDIFALSSRSEGMSNTILEAMAAGRAVVATNVGGNPELVADGRSGVLVDEGSDEAMANGLLALARDRERRTLMGQEGQRRARTEFALPVMVENYTQMYLEVAGGRRDGAQAATRGVTHHGFAGANADGKRS